MCQPKNQSLPWANSKKWFRLAWELNTFIGNRLKLLSSSSFKFAALSNFHPIRRAGGKIKSPNPKCVITKSVRSRNNVGRTFLPKNPAPSSDAFAAACTSLDCRSMGMSSLLFRTDSANVNPAFGSFLTIAERKSISENNAEHILFIFFKAWTKLLHTLSKAISSAARAIRRNLCVRIKRPSENKPLRLVFRICV